jgi:hypothetical protein
MSNVLCCIALAWCLARQWRRSASDSEDGQKLTGRNNAPTVIKDLFWVPSELKLTPVIDLFNHGCNGKTVERRALSVE